MTTTSPVLPNILLVDDNHDGLLVRSSLLVEAGFNVATASTGEEGLKVFQSSNCDVVVTDYRMPGMNGVELIVKIREINPSARIILLSGFVEPLGLTVETTGADVVLPKSAHEASHLVRWVRRLANRSIPRKPPAAQKGPSPIVRATLH